MNQYTAALRAMKKLLSDMGEDYWASWMASDLRRWKKNKDVDHHLAAYGAMGTLNDIIITGIDHQRAPLLTEPWIEETFLWLKSICRFLATEPESTFTAKQLAQLVGRRDASLAAFVGGDRVPVTMRELVSYPAVLTGCRCLTCGSTRTDEWYVEAFLADLVVPASILEATARGELEAFVERVQHEDLVPDGQRERVQSMVRAAGIALAAGADGWMRPCTDCGSDDTAVYRWRVGKKGTFLPSRDNLRRRKAGTNR